ncbi:MAG: betaine/proline/choline family ABC transporter ATP-binding protein [Acidaminococcus sp.]|jgi:glycine betaine/proline transport system ATP-binding protein|nr:betaine/proline/choline family ABC transporter ATP-binding protein [Acidaminococcus sp.]MCI2100190.1 betaine/proline/choline family ABC transporter ATP-binding protein [Acidaminococcus sp.]MCI2114509.1 betaine/proline/choline family ABC transporter ATP-binding protein [Acidaminococcus sp.]MCI2116487.1 betaine/proline/choline family ABC transporter ATP-binding protein [Acidaminococcus sp.]
MKESTPILEVRNLYKIFAPHELRGSRKTTYKLLELGATRRDVWEATGMTAAVIDVSFTVKRGELFVLIGLSGSGKSTLIRCLNRLHRPSRGSVLIEGEDITQYDEAQLRQLRRTKISMVFQNGGLLAHRDVLSNVAYGLEIQGVPKKEREEKAMEMIQMVGLEGHEHDSLKSLSGGMRQRVGIARALATPCDILLMDEAFSALDPLVKNDLQFELLRIKEQTGKTIIFITHDINEAFKLGDRVGILRDGRMVQLDTPENMLAHPKNDYVRRFIDSVDTTKVLTVRNIMTVPAAVVKNTEGAHVALKSMKTGGVSSAYVVSENMHFDGIITLDGALSVRDGKKNFDEVIIRDIPQITDLETPIAKIVPLAARTQFPLAVVDSNKVFRGIVTKASVLSSLSHAAPS